MDLIKTELPGFEYNFLKIEDENWGKAEWPFDYRSVMNYPSKIGSKVNIVQKYFSAKKTAITNILPT
jgi:hypothetical protein